LDFYVLTSTKKLGERIAVFHGKHWPFGICVDHARLLREQFAMALDFDSDPRQENLSNQHRGKMTDESEAWSGQGIG
jgi:hypothetical protein